MPNVLINVRYLQLPFKNHLFLRYSSFVVSKVPKTWFKLLDPNKNIRSIIVLKTPPQYGYAPPQKTIESGGWRVDSFESTPIESDSVHKDHRSQASLLSWKEARALLQQKNISVQQRRAVLLLFITLRGHFLTDILLIALNLYNFFNACISAHRGGH